jgi:uncharacterized protein YndB with AHSA1/START domain
MITREGDGVWVTIEETIALHHDDVFACLTTAGGLTRWFPVAADVDLRQGGLVVFGWDEEMNHKSTVAILDYDAGGRVVWDWYADHGDMHAPVYWEVKPAREKGSVVTLRQGPFRSDIDSLMIMAEEAETWRWHLCNLRCVLEARHDMRSVRPL